MGQISVQIFTHFTPKRGSYEQIAEITGLGGEVFVECDYYSENQVADAVSQALGVPRDQVSKGRTTEPVAGDFADFRRRANRDAGSDLVQRINAAL